MTDKPSLRLDPLVRSMARLMGPLATALGMANGKEAALLAAFALFLARCRTGGPADDLLDPSPVRRPRLNEALGPLHRLLKHPGDGADRVRQLTALVARADPVAILAEASERGSTNRPLVYFFEMLLTENDARLRRRRGVYFTPQPLVRFIVRSADELLRRELNTNGGLAGTDREIRVVDPACGTGAFLLEVLEHMRQRSVPPAACLVGIDVMSPCCRAATLLLENEIAGEEQPSPIPSTQKPPWSIHCANALEEFELAESIFADRVPVIVGNPPYSNFGRQNRGAWILKQLDEYKSSLNEQKLNLNDDFIKFFRWAQYWIDRAGRGVLAMVTNSTYLTGLTHRQMRASLAQTFDKIHVLDLHGNLKVRQDVSEGKTDQNVFPIQQGVAIGLFVKSGRDCGRSTRSILHAQLHGTKADKLATLSGTDVGQLNWRSLEPSKPFFFFVPRHEQDTTRYEQWPRLDEIFGDYISGVQSKRDGLFVGFTEQEIGDRMRRFLADAAEGRFEVDVPNWLRRKTSGVSYDPQAIRPYMVAPFDVRFVYYDPRLLGRARYAVMRHVDCDNRVLVFMRQTTNSGPYDQILATNMLVSDRVFYSAHGAPFAAPLFRQCEGRRSSNLAPDFVAEMTRRLGIPFEGQGDGLPRSFRALDVFHWIYGNLQRMEYREQYRESLRIDFPRVPWPETVVAFHRSVERGRQLLASHLSAGRFERSDSCTVPDGDSSKLTVGTGHPRWESSGRLVLGPHCVWPDQVHQSVWQFRWGGYPVLARWLKQRRGRVLVQRDQDHVRRMIAAIKYTIGWMHRE